MAGDWSTSESRPWRVAHLGARAVLGERLETPGAAQERAVAVALRARAVTVGAALALGMLVVVGLIARLIVVDLLSLQIDEPASLLGAIGVAEHGVPLLPSGRLYLHGATLSYLLAPLVWLGFDSMADLQTLRMMNAVIGTLAIVLTFRVGWLASGRRWVGLAAALLVAIDPMSVQWTAHLRMYALLQVLTLAIALVFLHALDGDRKIPVLLPSLFIVAAFTHIGIALLWPAMALVALMVHGRTLLGARRGIALGLALCLLGPLLFMALNHAFAPGTRSGTAALFGSVLDGESFLTLERFLRPSIFGWRWLFRSDWYAGLMPALLTILSGIVAGRFLLTETDSAPHDGRSRVMGALLAFHWIPVLLLGLFTTERQPRYLIFIYPFGLVLAVVGLALLVQTGRRLHGTRRHGAWAPILAAFLASVVILANLGQGLVFRLQNPTVEADFGDTLAYVAQHRAADELVFTAMTAPAYLTLGGQNLVFLAGMEETGRVSSYTHPGPDGRLVDYWVGVPAIGTTGALCSAFAAHPGGWVLIDTVRLQFSPAFVGSMATVIRDATTEVFRGDRDALALRIDPAAEWSRAIQICAEAAPGVAGATGVHLPPPLAAHRAADGGLPRA